MNKEYPDNIILTQTAKIIKNCPRCGNRLSIEIDCFGHYMDCIVCGFTKDLDNEYVGFPIKDKEVSHE